MKTGAIIQARQGSSRLPGKAMIDIGGKPALQRVVERIGAAKTLDTIVVATTISEKDNPIIELCNKIGCNYYRGSEDDVLGRVLGAAKKFEINIICEATADCLLIDASHIDTLIAMHGDGSQFDMTMNCLEFTFPRGNEIRVFNREALERVNREVDNNLDREHVSTWMFWNPTGKQNYRVQNWEAPPEQRRPELAYTLDTPEDLELISWLYSFESSGYNLPNGLDCREIINLIDAYPHMYKKVTEVQRKNYFMELAQAYEQLRSEKLNEKVQNPNNRGRKPGSVKRPARKPKSKQDDFLRKGI